MKLSAVSFRFLAYTLALFWGSKVYSAPDIFWQHRRAADSKCSVWSMSGSRYNSSTTLHYPDGSPVVIPDPNWKVAGYADFNADGKKDILWRHQTMDWTYVYYLFGSQPSHSLR